MKTTISTLSRLLILCVICGVSSGCSDRDDPLIPPGPNPHPETPSYSYPFKLGMEDIEISPNGETVITEPFGSDGKEFVTLSYIAEHPFISGDVNVLKYIQEGHVGSMSISDFYNVFSVAEYNHTLGLPDYVNSPQICYEYKWIKVKCYKGDGDNHTQLIISADENTTGQPRGMYLYFTIPSLGVVEVMQPGQPQSPS